MSKDKGERKKGQEKSKRTLRGRARGRTRGGREEKASLRRATVKPHDSEPVYQNIKFLILKIFLLLPKKL